MPEDVELAGVDTPAKDDTDDKAGFVGRLLVAPGVAPEPGGFIPAIRRAASSFNDALRQATKPRFKSRNPRSFSFNFVAAISKHDS